MKSIFVAIVGIVSFVYLIYPSLGVFELLPDAIPFVGSVDEITATTLLLAALSYFGIDVSRLFKRDEPEIRQIRETTYEEKK